MPNMYFSFLALEDGRPTLMNTVESSCTINWYWFRDLITSSVVLPSQNRAVVAGCGVDVPASDHTAAARSLGV